MQAIVYKQPKPITQYSQTFSDFVGKCLMKKKEDRPIITDLIEYFAERKVSAFRVALLTPLDQVNYRNYKSMTVQTIEKKRTQEKNMTSYNKDFEQLKRRI